MSEYIKMDEGLKSRREGLPKEIITAEGVTFDPIVEQCEAILWRRLAETIPPPEGMQATAWEVQEIDAHDCKVVCTAWVDPVEEERKRKEAEEEAERQRQLNKSPDLKAAENDFLSFCDLLTQSTSHTKLDIPTLKAIIGQISDPLQKATVAAELLSKDAACRTLADSNEWWYDCTWHEDIVE